MGLPTRPADQAAAFRRLRLALARNGLRSLWQAGRVRLVTMTGTSLVVAAFVFGMALYGFHALYRFNVPAKGLIVGGLFDLMFFTLGVMLLFSTGIILYASLFTAPEARFLLTTPARADRIFAAKFQAAVVFSSWGFVVLGMPVLVAYGVMAGVPGWYYPLLPAYLLGFVLLPGAASALFCLLLVRYLPRNRRQALILLGAVVVVVAGVWFYRTGMAAREAIMGRGSTDALEGFVGQFGLAQHPLAPSHWMTNGIMAASRNEFGGAVRPLAVLWSNGLMAYLAAAWASARLYRPAYDRIAGGGRGKKVYRPHLTDRLMELLVFYLDRRTRVLVVKDFRTFRRDPTQWAIIFIMGGLMLLGASNFRQYYTADLDAIDKYIIGLMNLGGVSVLLCAGLSRFIFPLVSLEGRKFWILGLLPLERQQILTGKFAFAATLSVLVAVGMVTSGELILQIQPLILLLHALTAVCVAVGLSGLNVGLGAYMPNFRETDPSKIVVGFSGTVNMVVGLLYVLLVVAVMAGPAHAAATMRHFKVIDGSQGFPWWVWAGVPVGVLGAVAATVLPLRAGAKALRESEF